MLRKEKSIIQIRNQWVQIIWTIDLFFLDIFEIIVRGVCSIDLVQQFVHFGTDISFLPWWALRVLRLWKGNSFFERRGKDQSTTHHIIIPEKATNINNKIIKWRIQCTNLSSLRGLKNGWCMQSYSCKQRDFFRNSNPWSACHNRAANINNKKTYKKAFVFLVALWRI